MERADRIEPISAAQSIQLLHLIKTRQDLIQDRSTGTMAVLKKRKAWDEITVLFNNLYPHQIRKRTRKQLKRSFEHIKRKVKKDDGEYKRRLKAAGGGHPPKPPQHNEETALATSMMSEELAMTDKQDMIDKDNMDNIYDTIKIQPCNAKSPIKIYFEDHTQDPLQPSSCSSVLASSDLSFTLPSSCVPDSQPSSNTTPPTPTCTTTPQNRMPASPSCSDFFSDSPSPRSPTYLSPPASPCPTPPTISAPIVMTGRLGTKKMVTEAYTSRRRRVEELHSLKIRMMKEEHKWQRKEHEQRIQMFNSGMARLSHSFDKFDSLVEAGKLALKAFTDDE